MVYHRIKARCSMAHSRTSVPDRQRRETEHGRCYQGVRSKSTSSAHVITLALLNDKDRIFSDYEKKELSDDYHKVFDLLMWRDYDIKDWALLLGEILNLISTDFFSRVSIVIQTVREMTLARKMTKAERN